MDVVGIAGPSCSGKSTVARLVAAEMGARLFHLDAHWIRGCLRPIVNGEPSFERPHQYNGAALARQVQEHLAAFPEIPVVVEGFLLYLYPECMALCTVMTFLDVPMDVLLARRTLRAQTAGDHAGGGKKAAAERAWLANGVEEWTSFGAAQAALPGVVRIDAVGQPSGVASEILDLIHPERNRGRVPENRPG